MVFYHPNESQSFSLDDRYKLFFPVRLISARNDYIHLAEFKWKWFRPHFFFISLCRWMNSSVTRPWWAFVQWRTQHTSRETARERKKSHTSTERKPTCDNRFACLPLPSVRYRTRCFFTFFICVFSSFYSMVHYLFGISFSHSLAVRRRAVCNGLPSLWSFVRLSVNL